MKVVGNIIYGHSHWLYHFISSSALYTYTYTYILYIVVGTILGVHHSISALHALVLLFHKITNLKGWQNALQNTRLVKI